MLTWNSVKTDKGLALEAKMVSGATLSITRCVSGTGTVPIVNLHSQTAIKGIAQTLSMERASVDNNQFTIRSLLTNSSLSSGYNLNQIGFYATDPDEGEILYAIAQSTTPKAIPSATESPGYAIQYTFTFENSVDATININLDTSGFATVDVVEDMINAANYAGASTPGGAATSANKINTDGGSETQPIYFKNGIPVPTKYKLEKSVPSDAKFTDTTYSKASETSDGLMSKEDKVKINTFDEIELGTDITD